MDNAPSRMPAIFEHKVNFGHHLYYPINDIAYKLCLITDTRSLTRAKLLLFQELGVPIDLQKPEL